MYKTNYRLSVVLAADSAISAFEDSQEHPGAATAALAQIKSCRDVDSVGEEANTIIPYHAIDYAVVEATRSEESDPVDDNCITDSDDGGDVETGTLTLNNTEGQSSWSDVAVALMLSTPATYSGIAFHVEQDEEMTFIVGVVPLIEAGGTFVLEGIPVGTQYDVGGATTSTQEGTIPGEAVRESFD